MPPLNTDLHVKMLHRARARGRLERGVYGLHWGSPERRPDLRTVRDRWLVPYVHPDKVGLEIGPGGGRWTRYMLQFQRVYVVEYHAEVLAEFCKNFSQPNIVAIRNNGTDFPGIPAASVDFVFSFGVFVHLDADIIQAYLANLRGVVHFASQLVVQYSDKDKPRAKQNSDFSDNDPRRMRAMVEAAGYRIVEEDTSLLNHSSIVRFVLA